MPPVRMVSASGANLVFLLSTPRAGSTLLGAMLANHSSLCCPNEPWLLLNLYGLFEGKPHATANENLATLALRELLSERQFCHAARAFALSAYNQKLQQQRKEVFIDKTPRYYQVLSFVDQLFPDAKKIWLQRNPLDVAVSYATTWDVPVAELAGETLSPNSLDLTIGLRNYLGYFRGQKNTFEIRYEDVVTNPAESMARLCEFLEVAYQPGMENYDRGNPGFLAMKDQLMGDKNIFSHGRPHTRSMDKWKQHYKPEELQRLINVIGEKCLKRLGYERTIAELKEIGCRFPGEHEVEAALFALEKQAMPAENGAKYHLLPRTKPDLDEQVRSLEADLIADLEEEAAELRRAKRRLELEVKSLRRDLRRARRNAGFRVVNGISRGLKAISRTVVGDGTANPVRFSRPRHAERNGSAPSPCSAELNALLETLTVRAAFFTSPTERNWLLHKRLRRKRARQLCFTPDELKAAINTFFAVPEEPLAVSNDPPPAFAHHDLVVIDGEDPGALWPLLKGRFWPHQRILLHGKGPSTEFPSTRVGPDFEFYAAPPAPWLDPRHAFLPRFAPWKSARRRLPPTLPSGNPWPTISVVTPSLNQDKFITDTIESVFGQNYPYLQYLVLDGGSTDETPAILNRYGPRLAYSCSQKDGGQADAINKGFSRATGDILAWLNSDDQYVPDALIRVAAAFDLFPEADIVVGGCGLLEATATVPSRIHHCALPMGKVEVLPLQQLLDIENCWLKGHFFYQPEVFWRRRIWQAAGAHVANDLYYCFDYDLWVRMAQAGAKVVHIPDLLALYRVHPAQKTYGDNLPYVPELKLVRSRRDASRDGQRVCGPQQTPLSTRCGSQTRAPS